MQKLAIFASDFRPISNFRKRLLRCTSKGSRVRERAFQCQSDVETTEFAQRTVVHFANWQLVLSRSSQPYYSSDLTTSCLWSFPRPSSGRSSFSTYTQLLRSFRQLSVRQRKVQFRLINRRVRVRSSCKFVTGYTIMILMILYVFLWN